MYDLMLIHTQEETFNMQKIGNRRFMFCPKTQELILGQEEKGKKLNSYHAEEYANSKAKAPFDSFIRGWVGVGKSYPHGVIHFAPHIPEQVVKMYEDGFSAIEMFQKNGANENTVIRGFGREWEQPLKNLLGCRKENTYEN